jgi:hypothetical protein
MSGFWNVSIEGYTPDELLALPAEQIDAFVLTGQPITFTAGSASLLGEFKIRDGALVVELAHVDGGGEGVLPTFWVLAERFAENRGLDRVEWIVHAVNCAKPNPKLRRVLERRGFVVRDVENVGEAYFYVHPVGRR